MKENKEFTKKVTFFGALNKIGELGAILYSEGSMNLKAIQLEGVFDGLSSQQQLHLRRCLSTSVQLQLRHLEDQVKAVSVLVQQAAGLLAANDTEREKSELEAACEIAESKEAEGEKGE